MLSREDRILSELIVSRGLATPEAVEQEARRLEDSGESGLVRALVSRGEIDARTGRQVHEEAREIDGLLRAELPEGKTLGEFRLLREIGRGGMGIVYEAEQGSLGRRVALKVLPAGAALDERLAIRFLREARTAARLQHPGIVPVFGTGREQGVLFFAMELIEGETLARRIDRGPLPAREAAGIASDVAHALQHAHEAGLIHRDVKPENVMIGTDGRTRLADFGLVHDIQDVGLTRSQYVLGTPAYTAPEQARGARVDPRSDVYGAGAVLYAMLSGRPPYDGEVPAAVLGRLIHEPPPRLAEVAPDTPRALIAICERAMERDADRRYGTAGAFGEALDGYLEHGDTAAVPATAARARALGLATGALAGVLLIGAAWLSSRTDVGSVQPPLLPVGLLQGKYRPFPTPPGWKPYVSLSPDGRTLAYVAGPTPQDRRLYLRREGQAGSITVPTGEQTVSSVSWSPDGESVAFCQSRQLNILNAASFAIESTGLSCGRLSWSPDGRRIVHEERGWPTTRLRVVDLASGASALISGPGARYPSWSADGRIAFVALRDGQYDIWTSRDDGSDLRRVTDDSAREFHPNWSPTRGRLYYGSNLDESPDLWSVQLDTDTGAVLSEPSQVTRGWMLHPFTFTVARKRERLAFVQAIALPMSWILDFGPDFSPLGPARRLQADVLAGWRVPQSGAGAEDWVVAAVRGEGENIRRFRPEEGPEWITQGPFRDGAPRWSPDRSTLAFHSDRSGDSEIWTVLADGTGLSQVTRGSGEARFPVWAPDGLRLAYTDGEAGTSIVTLADGRVRALKLDGKLDGFVPWSWSPDGRRLAGTADGVVIVDPDGGGHERITDYGGHPSWLADSGKLVFTHGNAVFLWDGVHPPRPIWSTGPNRLMAGVGVAPDGRQIYFTSAGSRENVWILDLDGEPTE